MSNQSGYILKFCCLKRDDMPPNDDIVNVPARLLDEGQRYPVNVIKNLTLISEFEQDYCIHDLLLGQAGLLDIAKQIFFSSRNGLPLKL